MTAASPDRLRPASVEPHLTTRRLGRPYHYFEETGSTNIVARELALAGAAEGAVVVAEAQTHGRGRLGRTWVSPPRLNLYLSVILRPRLSTAQVSQISVLAGVAVCETVREWCHATIKWPNDTLIRGRKVAGILAELEGDDPERFVILGIGVNLNAELDAFPPQLHDTATSVRLETGALVDRPRFLARLLAHLEARYDQVERDGFAPIAAAWCAESELIGRTIRVEDPTGKLTGVVLGLDPDGALRLRLAAGLDHRVVSGDVTVIGGYDVAPS